MNLEPILLYLLPIPILRMLFRLKYVIPYRDDAMMAMIYVVYQGRVLGIVSNWGGHRQE